MSSHSQIRGHKSCSSCQRANFGDLFVRSPGVFLVEVNCTLSSYYLNSIAEYVIKLAFISFLLHAQDVSFCFYIRLSVC